MDRTQKAEAVDQLHDAFKSTSFVVVAQYSGLTVAEITDLRRKMMTAGANFRVAKNRLVKIALKGTQFEGLDTLFTGPTGITFSDDAVSAAKVAADFAKTNEKFVVVGGGLGQPGSERPGRSRRWPSCLRSTFCAPASLAYCRPRQRVSQASRRLRPARSPVSSRRMPTSKPPNLSNVIKPFLEEILT